MNVATLTVNPAIDETVYLPELKRGHVHRAQRVRFNAGGKGINVAACLADFGVKTAVTGFLGKDNIAIFEALFKSRHIEDHFIRRAGETRTNIKIVDESETTDINLQGLSPSAQEIEKLQHNVDQLLLSGVLMVMSGSLLPKMPASFYAGEVKRAKNGAKIIVDCSGEALAELLKAEKLPLAIKPNIDELSQYCGHPLKDENEVLTVARSLIARGMQLVTVSLGAKGAIFVSKEQAFHASLPVRDVESTVGAGDAMVAGIASAVCENAPLERIARLATAFAVGKLASLGPALPDKATIEHLAQKVECRVVG
ncbi:1-phosphofructokinase [uncultured Bartonella sp.]|uniref:1-phosphofructokinase n=1 Tax=uncultured Bartonella sp. TaxID=104108 RepID=UPI00263554B5|nr:1-phosphofructokinase [uncultured Bartonella sp.]